MNTKDTNDDKNSDEQKNITLREWWKGANKNERLFLISYILMASYIIFHFCAYIVDNVL